MAKAYSVLSQIIPGLPFCPMILQHLACQSAYHLLKYAKSSSDWIISDTSVAQISLSYKSNSYQNHAIDQFIISVLSKAKTTTIRKTTT